MYFMDKGELGKSEINLVKQRGEYACKLIQNVVHVLQFLKTNVLKSIMLKGIF